MTIPLALLDTLQIISEQGKWYVPVPWNNADEVHQYLLQRDCPATLCLNPAAREARLELPQEADLNRVRAVLRGEDPFDPTKKAA
jgi:hypothetical protein